MTTTVDAIYENGKLILPQPLSLPEKSPVRTLVPLKGGVGTLKIPVATYYRPDGRNMNRFPDAKDAEEWCCAAQRLGQAAIF
jgi:hypothetical protein